MNITTERIFDALRHVMDPDLKKDLVTLGMIENITIDEKKISFSLVLTTPACPLKNLIRDNCIQAIKDHVDPDVEVSVEITSRTTSRRHIASNDPLHQEDLLKNVKNIIAVVSGKGGVGKSTVAANLAISLEKLGAKVGILDADIYGPSVPLMFDMMHAHPLANEVNGRTVITPMVKHNIKILSIGFFVDPEKALIWRGPMASNYLLQMLTGSEWGELDYLVIDMPPGTGDIHLTLVQNADVTGAIIVTTPQEVALADARKAHAMFTQASINVPILGLVENMSWFTPAELPGNKYFIFGKEGGKRYAEETGIPLLGQIPLVQSIREAGDNGSPIAVSHDVVDETSFRNFAENVVRQIAIQNALN